MPLCEWAEYQQLKRNIEDGKTLSLSGCIDSQKIHVFEGLCESFKCKIIATYSDIRVREIVEDLALYERNVYAYPAKDLIFYQADINGSRLVAERIKALKRLSAGRPMIIVTTFDALMTPMVPLSVYKKHTLKIDKKTLIDEKKLASELVAMGYSRSHQIEKPGEFSIRGGIIDVFDLTEENPYRIELWGEDIESIRSFDILSQRSIENLNSISVFPATEIILTESELTGGVKRIEDEAKKTVKALRDQFKTAEAHRLDVMVKTLREDLLELGRMTNLESYIRYFYDETGSLLSFCDANNTVIMIDEPGRVKEHVDAVFTEFEESMRNRLENGYILPSQAGLLYSFDEAVNACKAFAMLQLSTLDDRGNVRKPDIKVNITAKSISPYKNHFEMLLKDLQMYKKKGYRVIVLSGSRTRAKRLASDICDNDITAVYSEDYTRAPIPGEVLCMYGNVLKGFEYPLLKFVVISETDIFSAKEHKKRPKKKYTGLKINDFGELKVGDYVVHENHGLGIYKGIEKVEVQKVTKDYMKIEYRDGGILYVLATGLDVIQKYASVDTAKKPKLNKLGSKEWTNTKSKVKEAVDIVATDLVELYARRQARKGHMYSPDTVWQREFEELFPYEETEDQLDAVAATKRDMESSRIMDRLICGDVGYGKTEIALRAAFKAVSEGKQVAVLVPTTILAQQHYNTFTQRMKDFPIRIDMLSRFRSNSEIKGTLSELKKGMVDIVIGTHRLLSSDVSFKDLGLLVVDEEQRFGVTHKEKIKKLKEDVDVLTLTATPIPRTLHMSLVGIRDMSVLEEPPGERLPIQTYVCEYNEEMVREAVVRELSRGGQVFYVYNRVNNIADIAGRIAGLVPEANVAFAHGQMKETELEKIMFDFVDGEIDVLVSTTIIETGMDISNVNTIIIHDSDKLGLSQLYQLRGRVGRSNRTAYAFLMYKRDMMLKEVAEKRLEAIKEYTDLGSGFKIAMRDLEIRGAGNILGRRQHGHMEAVGYDLYCKMLNEAVMKLKGEDISLEEFATQIDMDVDAFIPSEYIVNEVQKLDIYKRIAGIESQAEADDMKDELRDRFGKVPKSAENLLKISVLRGFAHRLFITELKAGRGRIKLTMKPDASIRVEKIPDLMMRMGKGFNFSAKGTPYFIYNYKPHDLVEKEEEQVLLLTENVLKAMYEELL